MKDVGGIYYDLDLLKQKCKSLTDNVSVFRACAKENNSYQMGFLLGEIVSIADDIFRIAVFIDDSLNDDNYRRSYIAKPKTKNKGVS